MLSHFFYRGFFCQDKSWGTTESADQSAAAVPWALFQTVKPYVLSALLLASLLVALADGIFDSGGLEIPE